MSRSQQALLFLARLPESRVEARLDRLVETGAITSKERDQRLGYAQSPRGGGELVWFHAAGEEECRACVALCARLFEDRPETQALITTRVDQLPPSQDQITYVRLPVESLQAVGRFLRHWDPDCLVWTGGGYRPTLLYEVHKRGVPCLSVDSVVGDASIDVPVHLPGLLPATMRLFDEAFCSETRAVALWRRAGVSTDRIVLTGPLEDGTRHIRIDETKRAEIAEHFGTRPVWYAAALRSDEIASVVSAHATGLRRSHRLILVVDLENPQDVGELIAACVSNGMNVQTGNLHLGLSDAVQVLFMPNQSAHPLWFRIAPVSYMGGSLSREGAIDPYPAAAMGSAILHGPNGGEHSGGYARLQKVRATRLVRNARELAVGLSDLLSPDLAAELAHAAWESTSAGAETADRILDSILQTLDGRSEVRS
ncbi:3-deoxy-D-manno-octulosonic acid transferase [Celeribacter arenosi]